MNTKQWTCKDGTKIRIKDMTTSHLKNTINFLERLHQTEISKMYETASALQGEMASYYAEQDIDRAEHEKSSHPLYEELVEELERRLNSKTIYEK